MSALERIFSDYDTWSASAGGSAASTSSRARGRTAAEQLRTWGLPTHREENWRYANLRVLDTQRSFRPAPAVALPGALALAALPPAMSGFARLVFLNGRLEPAASDAAAVERLRAAAPGEDEDPLPPGRDQRHGLLSELFAPEAATLGVSDTAAIELLFITLPAAAGAAVYPRLNLRLARGARLALIERHLDLGLGTGTGTGTDPKASPGADPGASKDTDTVAPATRLVCAHSSIRLGADARLTHYRLQQCDAMTSFMQSLTARLDAGAEYCLRGILAGGASARSSAHVQLAGRGAALQWHELAVGGRDQVHDSWLQVQHSAPQTRTEEVFRGIATERARIAFAGHIHIDSQATDADTRQSLRGLVDGPGAEIDLRPQLQIDTDAVRAVHGATTGQLDENLLFYLLARGLDRGTARALLKWAFLGDVLKTIDLPELRHVAEQAAAGGLHDVLAAGALT